MAICLTRSYFRVKYVWFSLKYCFNRNSALQLACMKQNFQVIELLLRNNADPNDWNNLGWNSLITAVNYFHEDNSIMLLMLLQVDLNHLKA